MHSFTSYCKRLALLGIIVGLSSCGSSNDGSEDEAAALDSLIGKTAPAPVDDLNSDQSSLLDLALGEYEDGRTRGVSLGDHVNDVKSKETFAIFEELPGSVGYSVDTEQLETIDVVYYYGADQKVNRIGIDIYLNSVASMNDLWSIATRRLIKVYPHTTTLSESTIQLSGKKGKVVVEKVSDDLDHGLKLSFEPIGSAVALANR